MYYLIGTKTVWGSSTFVIIQIDVVNYVDALAYIVNDCRKFGDSAHINVDDGVLVQSHHPAEDVLCSTTNGLKLYNVDVRAAELKRKAEQA